MEYLVRYGLPKSSPRRLKIAIFPRAASKCAFSVSLTQAFVEVGRVCRFLRKIFNFLRINQQNSSKKKETVATRGSRRDSQECEEGGNNEYPLIW